MDYYAIGQRIRKFRKARGWSQEQLAERVDISVTHMSHIENANTKLSLSVFAAIAEALEVQADALLYDAPIDSASRAMADIAAIIAGCDARQARIIADIARATKQSFDAYL